MKRENPSQKQNRKTLKRVLAYVKKYPISLVCTLLFAALSVAFTLYVPILVGDAIDCIIGKEKVYFIKLTEIFVKIGVSLSLCALSTWLTSVLNNRISLKVVESLRQEAFEKLQRLPLSYLDTHARGDILSRIVSDAEHFADGLLMGFTQFFTGALTILGTIGFMFLMSWKIALVVVLVTPVSLFVARYIANHTHEFFIRQAKIRAEQAAFTEEMISGLKTVQAYAREDENAEKFDEIEKRLKTAALDATFYSSLVNPSTRFVNNLVYALVALIGAFGIVGGGFTVGGLTKFLAYANQYTKPFNEISGVVAELQNALVCASRIFELLDETEEENCEYAEAFERAEGNVDVQEVSFSYVPEKPLIEHLNLTATKGKKVAIVGPTGSGKTTLVNLLMRFYETTGGRILIDGKDVKTLTRHSLREKFGMVLQDTWLKEGTVKENIRLGRKGATDEEVVNAAKAAHAHGFIKRLEKGYDTVLIENGGELSAGQKQLLCIARIMLCLPPMLILDEATSSIDTRTEQKIGDAFDKLMVGRTSFIVAHRLSTIRSADIILVMNEGKIVEQGEHEQLLKNRGFYYSLYQSQFA